MNFARGDVFGKQARLLFAEFLPFVLVFPGAHTCVGLTILCVWLSCYLCGSTLLSAGVVSYRRLVRSDLYMCGGEGRTLLLLILA